MSDASWKAWEREVARDLGGRRAGPLGKEGPDIIDVPGLAVQCKYQARLSLRKNYLEQTCRDANGVPWVLALKEKGTGIRLAILDWKAFADMFRELTRLRKIVKGNGGQ